MATNAADQGLLSFFLFLLVLSTTALLMALLTPSWQVVLLEDGRTEHHHGLWLDCKRDYSYDYGRPREYYEALHRRFDLAGPFDQFWLPALMCVYKFDYWLDDEDWYEFGYDENRLWGDAYQHLFLGWKIATLAAHLFATVCALVSVLMIVCAYCHRLCTCVAAVLITLAVLSGVAGNMVFYMFASDQNTNIVKEEDGIYEQHFGWSFWVSVLGNCLMLVTSMVGCVVTKAVLGKRRRAPKFVKIHLSDFGDDSTQLLRLSAASSAAPPATAQPFRRSRSTIYRIDSQDLRRWERDRMRSMDAMTRMGHFKRTNSMPMIRRESMHQNNPSTSVLDLSQAQTEPGQTHEFIPHREPLPSTSSGRICPSDVVYEYVDQGSLSMASTLKAGDFVRPKSKLNVYDPVPMGPTSSTPIGLPSRGQLVHPLHQQQDVDYLQPKALSTESSSMSSGNAADSPLIVPIDRTPNFRGFSREVPGGASTFTPHVPLSTFPHNSASLQRQRQQQQQQIVAELEQHQQEMHQQHQTQLLISRPKPPPARRSQRRLCQPPTILSDVPTPSQAFPNPDMDSRIRINTFQQNGTLLSSAAKNRSITDLIPVGSDQASSVHAFEREPTTSTEKSTLSTTATTVSDYRPPIFLGGAGIPLASLQERVNSAGSGSTLRTTGRRTSEADRSLGSSRVATFLGTPPDPSDPDTTAETVICRRRTGSSSTMMQFGQSGSGTDV